ncbi:MAG: hypothetical protein M1823_004183 [Watsoniomyces obsoletus]|nr:MAG: hypothetical protein M1823_004183 [Watsoniomyces obsoletus]
MRAPSPEHSSLEPTDPEALHDLVCVGFGPASLAIAVALEDTLTASTLPAQFSHLRDEPPKVAFLERQPHFSWHEGMLLPDAKMQINFIKDLATLRNPRSEFTFLNYLHHQGRLVHFTNLGTFFPLRLEYQDYMRWCAERFRKVAHYGQEVLEILPEDNGIHSKVEVFKVTSRERASGQIRTWRARHVVVAVGGKPKLPDVFLGNHSRVVHSSQYLKALPSVLHDREGHYRLVVIGGGQSAAEIFNDLHTRYPNCHSSLVIKGGALKPSDDSPFVNEIFDPDQVDEMFQRPRERRAAAIEAHRDTNYGVVRLELLEHLYAKMYEQRLREPDERRWKHRIIAGRKVSKLSSSSGAKKLRMVLQNEELSISDPDFEMVLEADAVIVATGYERNAHEYFLRPATQLMPKRPRGQTNYWWTVGRNYRVQMDPRKVSSAAGVWLQGCNENTHGLSDTLLSILATRGGEMVESLFGRGAPDIPGGEQMTNGH